jgi:cytochrome c2
MKRSTCAVLCVLVLLLAACGGQPGQGAPAASGAGDAAAGQKLFEQMTIGKNNGPGCVTCHSVEPGKTIVGPSLAGIATDAAGAFTEEGYEGAATNAADWLKEAIVNPEVDVVEGFPAGVMPKDLQTQLSSKELSDLVAYLQTLK